MSTRQLLVVDVADILALRLECVTCGATVVFKPTASLYPLDAGVSTAAAIRPCCLACGQSWPPGHRLDESYREASSERVHEAHTRLHSAGRVVGGRVFGYRNQEVFKGVDAFDRPLRSDVERVIDDDEAAVVRRIFELYDSGLGLKRIAKLLTTEGALSPRHYRRTDGLGPIDRWSPSTVRAVLTRETYHGVVVWNKTRKRNDWGKWSPSDRPESEWIRTVAEGHRLQ